MLQKRSDCHFQPRVGLLGLVHETNTFAQGVTSYLAFSRPVDREAIQRGPAMLNGLCETSVLSGAVAILRTAGTELVPIFRAAAAPSATVSRQTWTRLITELMDAVRLVGQLDGILLELHGAMVSEDTKDCEGVLLRMLRDELAPECVVVATLDFHANVSAEMVECTHRLVPFKTYPHVDMRETGARAASMLLNLLHQRNSRKAGFAWSHCRFLLPLVSQYTGAGPMLAFMHKCTDVSKRLNVHVAFCAGFPMADTPDTGPSIIVYSELSESDPQDATNVALAELQESFDQLRADFVEQTIDVAGAMSLLASSTQGLTILADIADNPGAGCLANDLTLLKALHRHQIPSSLIATLSASEWAQRAHEVGLSGCFQATIAGCDEPQMLRVLYLSDGQYRCTGPMWAGRQVRQGLTARLAWGCVELIVSSNPVQALDVGALTCTGVQPQDYRVLVLKSSVHFRAAFEPLAQRVITVDTSLISGKPHGQPIYRHLRAGVAISPSLIN